MKDQSQSLEWLICGAAAHLETEKVSLVCEGDLRQVEKVELGL